MTNWDFGQEDFSKKKNNLYVISILVCHFYLQMQVECSSQSTYIETSYFKEKTTESRANKRGNNCCKKRAEKQGRR